MGAPWSYKMADSDDIVNEILRKTRPGFTKASSKPKSDAMENRAKPEAQSPDLAYMRAKLGSTISPSDGSASSIDAGDLILNVMAPKNTDSGTKRLRDTRIVKIENDEGDKTRAVFDITGKKKIGEAS